MRRAVLGLGVVLTACSLLVRTNDLDDGASDSGTVADAAAEGSVADASDAGGDVAVGRGCRARQPAPTLCFDFDTAVTVSDGLFQYIDDGGTIAFEEALAWSPPRSARFTQTAPKEAFLGHDLPALGAGAHYEMALRFEHMGTNGLILPMGISQPPRTLILYVAPGEALLQDDPPHNQFVLPAFEEHRWYTVAIDLVTGPPTRFTVAIDGHTQMEDVTIADRAADQPVSFSMGPSYFYQSTTPWDVVVDDVIIEAR